jgi:hypothetical protein
MSSKALQILELFNQTPRLLDTEIAVAVGVSKIGLAQSKASASFISRKDNTLTEE